MKEAGDDGGREKAGIEEGKWVKGACMTRLAN